MLILLSSQPVPPLTSRCSVFALSAVQIKPHPWPKVFRNKAPANAIDLVSKWLRYEPKSRLDPFESLAHPFFDELREPGAKMPNQQPIPEKLFVFSEAELKVMAAKNLTKKLIPAHLMKNYKLPK